MKWNNIRYEHAFRIVIASVFLLGTWGILTIISSQYQQAFPLRLAGKQLLFFFCGLTVLEISRRIPFRNYCRHAVWLNTTALLLLVLVLFFGDKINGMRGWFRMGEFSLQPSEIFKGFFLLGGVILLNRFDPKGWKCFAAGCGWIGLWTALIFLQPDFGTASVYVCGFLMLYFFSGGSFGKLSAALGAGTIAAVLFIWHHPYAWKRFAALYSNSDPLGAGWHVNQLKFAIARGGWFGTKMGGAYWSNSYVPLAYNDSAFATMFETLGFLGTLPVFLAGTALFLSLGALALQRHLCRCARILIASCTMLLVFQALLHISVNICLIPPTGLTLPLISYGGSSFIGSCFLIGIALSAAATGSANRKSS